MHHGGRIAAARVHYPHAPQPWLDLSTGISAHAWPDTTRLQIDWQALPDPEALGVLEEAAAQYFGVAPAHVCALPGTELGLRLLGTMLRGAACHVAPGYRTHAEMVPQSRPVAADALDVVDCRTLILANPSNPEGRVLLRPQLLHLLDRCERAGGWLVVDEAYADAQPDVSLSDVVADDRRLIIFRSFGKFFGLAGVRLGFVLGPVSLVAQFRSVIGSWPLSAAAIAIGTAAYRDAHWVAVSRIRLPQAAAALDTVLTRHGLQVTGDCPLFRLVESDAAPAIFERLMRAGILTRPFDYAPRWLRIGLPGDAAALERLDRALADG